MKRSTDRILTTHVGRLQRPDQLTEILVKQQAGGNVDEQALAHRLKAAIADVVKQQAEAGVTVVNDGEFGKISWLVYAFGRLEGFELRPIRPDQNRTVLRGKDRHDFADYYAYVAGEGGRTYYRSPGASGASGGPAGMAWECVGPIRYRGHDALRTDIEALKSAMTGTQTAG